MGESLPINLLDKDGNIIDPPKAHHLFWEGKRTGGLSNQSSDERNKS